MTTTPEKVSRKAFPSTPAPPQSRGQRLTLIVVLGILVPMWTALFSVGLALPNAPALALARHGDAAGTAAALLGAVQFGVGAIVSPVVGILGNDAVAMGTVVAGGLALALVVLVAVVRPWQLADIEEPV